MKKNTFDGVPAAERLLRASMSTKRALLERYKTPADGFEEAEAAELRESCGRNELSRGRREPLALKFLRAFVNPFTIVLAVIAAVSFVTDVLMAAPGREDPSTVVIICVMVAVSGLLRFVQEARADRAAAKLKEMVHTTASVRRGFEEPQEIPLAEIVPGDLVVLSAGDLVPADLRVLSCKDLFVNQAALTGESEPVEKSDRLPDAAPSEPLEAADLVFMLPIEGSARRQTSFSTGAVVIYSNFCRRRSSSIQRRYSFTAASQPILYAEKTGSPRCAGSRRAVILPVAA